MTFGDLLHESPKLAVGQDIWSLSLLTGMVTEAVANLHFDIRMVCTQYLRKKVTQAFAKFGSQNSLPVLKGTAELSSPLLAPPH